ncbi:MAG: hypothetical protein NWR67_03825 [Saprospiraceae bacterium]|nr:hypothetical protein [Saprospiraceae bacterium]MDP4820106.1 hypothetical protein [Saprospiraceae bacterium]MDP4998536.1 hypothetical protein [Saprospiraceae bacterium]
MDKATVRYTDEELEEFRVIISTKLEQAQMQLDQLVEQIMDITENTNDEFGGDWIDDSLTNNEVELLNTMAIRQRKYLQDLENALVRIRNKTYGICTVSGDLIDKNRLLAVPTTTKSLVAKEEEKKSNPKEYYSSYTKKATPAAKPGKILTKIHRKPKIDPEKIARPKVKDDFDLLDDDELENDMNITFEDIDTIDTDLIQEEE